MTTPLMEIKDLQISFLKDGQINKVVKNISFKLHAGETLGLVGESGSGKSISALSILQLLPKNAIYNGQIQFNQQNLLAVNTKGIRKIRGNQISMIFQEPMTALNPLNTIEKQICEVLKLHLGMRSRQATIRALELLKLVGIQEPEKKLIVYPHELAGGQRQRAMIAMALACEPRILIADEPTTALDVTTQRQVLTLFTKLQKKIGMAILFISHDLNLIRHVSHRICVMKAGKILESGDTVTVFTQPKHPYTIELLQAEPYGKPVAIKNGSHSIIVGNNICVWFPVKTGFFRKTVSYIKAVTNLSITLNQGETLGIVGKSGSGKTTLGMALLRLQKSTGSIVFEGYNLHTLTQKQFRPFRRRMQVVFQDPFGSLSPRMTIRDIIGEGLVIHQIANKYEREYLIINAMNEVGLNPDWRHRYPHEFSGGQRQRIAIARTLILKPKVIILDEPTSALDRTVQSQVIELLKKLQNKYNLSFIFISHDLAVVKAISHRLIVMKDGQAVEEGTTEQIFHNPRTEYTRELLHAAFTHNR